MSHRPKQLGSVLQRAIQSIIERGFSDPRIQGVITVTRVKVSPDLKDAIIYVTVIPADDESLTLHGLRSAGAYIRRQAGELVAIHRLPQFEFRIDEQIKREASVLAAIKNAVETLDEPTTDADSPSASEHENDTSNEDAT